MDLQLLVYQGQAPLKQKYPVISSSWTKNWVSAQKSKYNSNQAKQDAYVRLRDAYTSSEKRTDYNLKYATIIYASCHQFL